MKVPEDTLDFLQPLAGLHWLNLYDLLQRCNFQVAQADCAHALAETMQTVLRGAVVLTDGLAIHHLMMCLMLVMPAGSDSSAAVDVAFNRNGRGM